MLVINRKSHNFALLQWSVVIYQYSILTLTLFQDP